MPYELDRQSSRTSWYTTISKTTVYQGLTTTTTLKIPQRQLDTKDLKLFYARCNYITINVVWTNQLNRPHSRGTFEAIKYHLVKRDHNGIISISNICKLSNSSFSYWVMDHNHMYSWEIKEIYEKSQSVIIQNMLKGINTGSCMWYLGPANITRLPCRW